MYRRNRRFAPLLALSAVLALGMAACGGGDDEEAETTTTVEQVQGSDMVTIDMTDFAFNVSGPLTAGGTIQFTNSGKEMHMTAMWKMNPGVTLDQFRAAAEQALQQGPPGGGGGGEQGGPTTTGRSGATTTSRASGTGDIREQVGGTTTTARGGSTTTGRGGTTTTTAGRPDPFADLGQPFGFPGNVMSPGQTAEVTAPNLTAGNYALVCFIAREGEGRPHIAHGMIGELQVVDGPPPAEPTAAATYTVTPGQPIQGPATLTPGRHTLKFEAAAGSQQLEPGVAKLESGTTISELYQNVGRIFESEQPPPQGAANQLGGQVIWAGSNLEGVTSFYLTTEFTAGNYSVFAFDVDDPANARAAREVLAVRVAEGSTTTAAGGSTATTARGSTATTAGGGSTTTARSGASTTTTR